MEALSIDDRNRQDPLRELNEADESLPACFERVFVKHGRHTALVSDHWQPTYAELNATANRLAHAIVVLGSAPGDRIAILMQHDAPAIATVLAVLKAGGIVVALNLTHPVARLRELIEDSAPSLVITDCSLRKLATEIAGACCPVVGFEEQSAQGPDHNMPIVVPPEQIAFLSYTSGSTGRPKGVMVTHRQYRRNVHIHTEAMEFCTRDRVPLFGSLAGGQGMTVTWCTLLNGAALCPFPVIVKGVAGLVDWMTRRVITVYASSASIFRSFMKTLDPDFRFSGVRAVRLSSEPATSDDFKQFQAHFPDNCWFVHTLSSTETSNIAWSRRLRGDTVPEGQLPIGAVSKWQEVLILDESDRPVAAGEVGEIVVRSRYLAAGYWRNPRLTSERFSADLDGKGTRLFRTGDLGRIDPDRMLHFCGRRDDRIKIRGNRVELSEIEQALHRLAGIERAAVEGIPRARREPTLVGFITIQSDQSWSHPELRRALRAMLPDHMVPSEFVILQSFPLTPTGKIDRDKLRQDYRPQRQRQPDQQPRTETESLLAGIWAEVLELSDIGRDEDFFVLGGDSLMAAVLAARVYGELKVELNLTMFADHPTLAELALVIDRLRTAEADDTPQLMSVPRTEPLPMSFWQERTWNLSQTSAGAAGYTIARIYCIAGSLNVELLHDCMNKLVYRNEILRTIFALQGGRAVQIVQPPVPTPLTYIDLTGATDAEAEATLIFKREAAWVFDLTRGPLLRFSLVRLHDNEYRLLRVAHHIICDGVSWLVYFRELAKLYEANLRGTASSAPAVPALQYGDYAVWQRKVLHPGGAAYRRAVSWWKENLSGAPPPLRLPFTRVEEKSDVAPADGVIPWGVERHVSSRLNALGPGQNTTRLMVRLAAFAALVAAEAGEPDVILGMYVSSRNRLPLQNMIGYFSNLVTLRFRYSPRKSFFEWLSIVRGQVLDAEAHSEIPYDVLLDELYRDGKSLPEIKIIFHVSSHQWTIEFADIRLTWSEPQRESIPWGLTMNLDDQNEQEKCREHDQSKQEHCRVVFDPRMYDPSGVRVFVERYKRLLDAVSRHPDKTLADLLAMSQSESQALLQASGRATRRN
jgi:amino acid adenylation domain-containing protein